MSALSDIATIDNKILLKNINNFDTRINNTYCKWKVRNTKIVRKNLE